MSREQYLRDIACQEVKDIYAQKLAEEKKAKTRDISKPTSPPCNIDPRNWLNNIDDMFNNIEDPELYNIVDEMYRINAKIGSGSTADALRNEAATGKGTWSEYLKKETWHAQKAQEKADDLQDLIDSGKLDCTDMSIAESLLDDLNDALNKWYNR